MLEKASINDVWYQRLHLTFEFVITAMILGGSYLIVINAQASPAADSGAAAVVTLVVGYWFGRRENK